MLLSMFGGQASACVALPGGTTVLPSSVEVVFDDSGRVRIIVRGYQTTSQLQNQFCAVGMGVDAAGNLIMIDSATVVYADGTGVVGGMSFVNAEGTADYLLTQDGTNAWAAFNADVMQNFAAGDLVDLVFEGTVPLGTTIDQILAQLSASNIAVGEVTVTGTPIAGGSFTIAEVSSVQPVSISLAQSQATTSKVVSTFAALLVLMAMSVSIIALRRKEQA